MYIYIYIHIYTYMYLSLSLTVSKLESLFPVQVNTTEPQYCSLNTASVVRAKVTLVACLHTQIHVYIHMYIYKYG